MPSRRVLSFELRKARNGFVLRHDVIDANGEQVYDEEIGEYVVEETVFSEPIDPTVLGEQIVAMMVEQRLEQKPKRR